MKQAMGGSMKLTVGVLCLLVTVSGVASPDLKSIMADPDWIGPPVEAAWWQLDGSGYHYRVKRKGSSVRDVLAMGRSGDGPARLTPSQLALSDGPSPKVHQGTQQAVSSLEGTLVLRDLEAGTQRILFAGDSPATRPEFSVSGDAVFFKYKGQWWQVSVLNGAVKALTQLEFSEAPHAPADDALAVDQLRLFTTLERERRWQQEEFERNEELAETGMLRTTPWYLGKGQQLVDGALSPDGRWLLAVVAAAVEGEGKADKMPHYVSRSGYVDVEDVRRLVGRDEPTAQALWLLDLNTRERFEIAMAPLPGIDEDPLADLKDAQGIKPRDSEKPRPVTFDRIVWHPKGDHALVQVHTIDNKDRWTVRLDTSSQVLHLLEHLHDPAWINWQFNELGWIPGSDRAWWLSESSGYSHLYSGTGEQDAVQHTGGEFEIEQITWRPDGGSVLFLANRSHPTEYDLYSLELASGHLVRETKLLGVEDFALNPDGRQVLLRYSSPYQPTQAAVLDLTSGNLTLKTQTLSVDYAAIEWQLPEIVAIPSHHGVDRPIWSKFYPARGDFEGPRPIVMFVHGAGYTQNTHHKFPYYFREQMFHNLLTVRGYHVLDMDYRASRGYGRDWRTAIYRQMGTPELEDLIDGVRWLVEEQGGDPQRVGVYGGSYGGFMAFMALFKAPEVFAAGAALRPVTDWRHYNHSYTSNILNTPEVDPEAHHRSSPIEFVEGFEGALLISHGMLDDNVFYKDSVRLVQRLIELEKENWELASYPLEPHGYVHPESWLDQYRRILKLFETQLRE